MALLSLLDIKEKFTSQRWHIAKQTPDGVTRNEFRNIINTEKGIDIFQIIKAKKKKNLCFIIVIINVCQSKLWKSK